MSLKYMAHDYLFILIYFIAISKYNCVTWALVKRTKLLQTSMDLKLFYDKITGSQVAI